jgi:hypothetical protein
VSTETKIVNCTPHGGNTYGWNAMSTPSTVYFDYTVNLPISSQRSSLERAHLCVRAKVQVSTKHPMTYWHVSFYVLHPLSGIETLAPMGGCIYNSGTNNSDELPSESKWKPQLEKMAIEAAEWWGTWART